MNSEPILGELAFSPLPASLTPHPGQVDFPLFHLTSKPYTSPSVSLAPLLSHRVGGDLIEQVQSYFT